jgi:hypothetical protein
MSEENAPHPTLDDKMIVKRFIFTFFLMDCSFSYQPARCAGGKGGCI